jgi:hypothetical protein
MDCRTFRRQHLAFVDDTLPGIDVVQMERHRQRCASCARLDAEIRRSLLLIRNNLPTIQPSADFANKLARRLEAERARQATPAPFFRGPGLGGFLSMSASLVALGVLAVSLNDRPALNAPPRLPSVVIRPHGVPLGVNAALPAAPPAFMATMSTGMAVWPALLLMEEAQSHYARGTSGVRPANYTPTPASH